MISNLVVMAHKYLIVGVCGATNSGKTTTLLRLRKDFPGATTMNQDSYFLDPADKRLEMIPELNHANWECLSSLDMETMLRDVHKWIDQQQSKGDNSTNLLLVEGFLIFNYRPLAELFNLKYFLKIDRETCEQRRSGRTYIPPDPPGYFQKVVWPEYVKHLEELEAQTDICYLDGTEDQMAIERKIRDDILKSL